MQYLPNGEQMKRADEYTIRTLGVPSLFLMERAAAACVKEIQKRGHDLKHICVVCGSGNNGGDGLAIGRMLAQEGLKVTAVMAGQESHMTDETLYQKKRFEESGGILSDRFGNEEYSIIIDALFGVGLSREISGKYEALLRDMNEKKAVKVAVDIPSGICAGTGAVLGTAFSADYTVTFQAEKLGLVLYPGKKYAGEVITADIGISEDPFREDKEVACALQLQDYRNLLPERNEESHKGSFGKVLLIAGSRGMSGAAYLNALAAYRMGAGLVRIYTVEENRAVLQSQLPEAIVTAYERYDEEEVKELLAWADVVGIGSGIGIGKTAESIFRQVMRDVEIPCVVDADGLNLMAAHRERTECPVGKKIVLTPHIKEFSRLTGKEVAKIKEDRAKALREFTEDVHMTCILKDARTLTLASGGRICVNCSGSAAMAKAGAGDVLAGIVTALLAQGLACEEAAALGAYLHGCAGEMAAEEKGLYSILAREIADNIGRVIKTWEEDRYEAV